MKISMQIKILLLSTYFSLFLTPLKAEDLYKVLGVSRSATQREIKKAYKDLAREWHPDKNDDPDAAVRFTKINEAYETLGDSGKREQYDRFGYTAAREQKAPSYEFHNPFGNGFFNFNFNGFNQGESIIQKFDINLRVYETKILPESDRKPCFLYTYTDFCFDCARIEHLVEKLIRDLDDIGVCVGTFHAGRARSLSGTIRIERVPTMLMLIDGRLSYFRGGVSTQNLNNFVRGVFPNNIFTKINDANAVSFLEGWQDNHMRALLFVRREDISLRFLAPAYYHREFIKFGYVNMWQNDNVNLTNQYNVNRYRETLLMFNEDKQSPVATLVMPQLSRKTMEEVLTSNRFIILPRLSSQKRFEEICPEERKAKRKRLCIVLVTKKSETAGPRFLDSFRKFVQSSSLTQNDRVKFAYIYEDTQNAIVKSLAKGDTAVTEERKSKVVIIWRMERNHLSYNWLSSGWSLDNEMASRKHLEEQVQLLLNTDQSLAYRVMVPEFNNEHSLHLLIRIGYKLLSWAERAYNYLSMYDAITYITVVMSLFLMLGMGFFLSKMAAIEEEQIREKMPKKVKPRPPSVNSISKTINLYELMPETYEQLVTHSDTGLTIIVLVDDDSKTFLLKEFGTLLYPLTRYSGLTFGFLNLDLYMGWYRHLLEETVNNKVDLSQMKSKHCLGTVLAINGHRTYYYIYHPKPARKWIRHSNKVSRAIGFVESDDSDSDDDGSVPIDQLLKGLTAWTDRVFDGSVPKVRIQCWPEMAMK